MTTLQSKIPELEEYTGLVRAVDMPFNFAKAVDTWNEYGYSEVPLLVRAADGKVYDDRKFKGWFHDGIYRKLLKRNYTTLPNEKVDEITHKVIRVNSDKFGGLYLFKTHTAYNGDAQYWEIRTKKQYKVHGSYRGNNDMIQLGVVLRNSVGCNISFGMDVFTFAQICSNGAIAKGNDMLSLKVKHYGAGSLKAMTENLERRIEDTIREGVELIKNYEKAAKLRLQEETAKLIAKRIPNRYLPDYIRVHEKTGEVTLAEKSVSLWEAFNDSTAKIWHNDISFLTKSDLTVHLHRVLNKAVAPVAV